MTDPTWQAQALARAKVNVERSKGRLFARLTASPAAKEQLKALLAAAEVRTQIAAVPPRPDASQAETNEWAAQLQAIRAEREAQVRTLLSPDDYAVFTAYEQSEAYRGSVDQIANIMRARGAKVTDDLQETLLDGYAAAIAAAAREAANDPGGGQLTALSESQRAELSRQQRARVDRYLATTLGHVLGPDDLRLFEEAQSAQDRAGP